MRTGHQDKPPVTKALLASATVAVAATTCAYFLGGPKAEADQRVPVATRAATAVTDASALAACDVDARYPKRQLRGVWISTVSNLDWPSRAGLSMVRQQAEYRRILDAAVDHRFNAVFVQVRPAADAVFKSAHEPWSQFLTGTVGKNPGWDPLPFLIDEAHKRGLEFHAWFNPYRAAVGATTKGLPASHPARQHPEWVVRHEGRLYFNPGLPAVREHVTKVVADVVKRYDVDGVHFDDYFYPYPGNGTRFADQAAFEKYGKDKGLAAWRRDNVNKLVAEVDQAVHAEKPYVKFGISPFGIWRNHSNDPKGSRTAGMSAYDEIFADPLAWIKAGSVDYITPQLYWPRGMKAADYSVLAPWWAKQVKGTDVDLYIGQALYRVGANDQAAWTVPGELPAHLTLNRKYSEIHGDVYFSAKQLLTNPLDVLDRLDKDHYSRPALLPLIKERGGEAPAQPSGLQVTGSTLAWKASPGARGYAVYRVNGKPGKCAAADAEHLVAIVPAGRHYTVEKSGTYLVSALDRLQNESAATEIEVKLP